MAISLEIVLLNFYEELTLSGKVVGRHISKGRVESGDEKCAPSSHLFGVFLGSGVGLARVTSRSTERQTKTFSHEQQ